jgi:twitching motility protein PilT
MSLHDPQLLAKLCAMFPGREISDVQFRSERFTYLHTDRGIEVAEELGPCSPEDLRQVAIALYSHQAIDGWGAPSAAGMEEQLWQRLQERRVVDFSCEAGTLGSPVRMRVQAHYSESGLGITCRMLRAQITAIEDLNLDPLITDNLRELVQRRFGLGLVTGPTGSGKSTTLAAILDYVRRNFSKHIVTIEDPIEYRYSPTMADPNRPERLLPSPSLVTQQEVGRHTLSYQTGLKEVLRKTPHIILLGEIRDRETMETCIEAAQTGHFVLSTLHTRGAVKTIDRILEFFPKPQHASILNRLSETLTFILSQSLLTGFNSRVLVTEYMQNTTVAVGSGIRAYDGSANSLNDALRSKGNLRWEDSLNNAYRDGRIAEEVFRANQMD